VEKTLLNFDGVTDAQAYVSYAEDNKLLLTASIGGNVEREKLQKYLSENLGKHLIPSVLIVNGERI
jgi:hypothetical protein